jgi:hypothetical protein
LGHERDEVDRFLQTLRHAGYRSVDRFLESNPECMTIGKKAIATILLACEKPENLFPPKATGPSHWYQILSDALDPAGGSFAYNDLRIITFNYDRSIEHYLFTVLKNRFDLDEATALAAFRCIPIVHVHGSLGAYPPTEETRRPYGGETDADSIERAATASSLLVRVTRHIPSSMP